MTITCRSGLLTSLMALSITLLAGKTRAESPSTGRAPVGSDEESLIARGIELREKGDDEAALGAFRKAYEVAKGGRPLAQVALAEQALGRWVDAESHLSQAIVRTDDPWIGRNKPLLDQALTEIQGHLGSLQLSGGVEGAQVSLNGAPVGSFPLKAPIRVPAGSIALEVRAAGYLPVVRTVTVPNGGLARESVVLVATGPAAGAATSPQIDNSAPVATVSTDGNGGAPPSVGWRVQKKVAVGLGVAAGASLGLGGIFLLIGENHAKDFNKAGCSEVDPQATPTCRSLAHDTHSARTAGVVGLVGAALFGGAATYLFFTDRSRDEATVAVAGNTASFRCVPSLGAGISCVGQF